MSASTRVRRRVKVVTTGPSDPIQIATEGPGDPVIVVASGPAEPVRTDEELEVGNAYRVKFFVKRGQS